MSENYQAPGVLSWGTWDGSANAGLGDVTPAKARAEMQRAVGYQGSYTSENLYTMLRTIMTSTCYSGNP